MARGTQRGLSHALRHRDFRLLVAAYSLSAVGSWAYNVGLAVYVYDRTHSAAWVGAVTVGRFIPSVLFGAYGGVVAERFERARLMTALDALCALLMTALSLVAAYHGPALLVIGIGGINALITTPYEPAVAAITPQLVPEDDFAAANTLTSTVGNLAVIAGPALGALLFLVASPVRLRRQCSQFSMVGIARLEDLPPAVPR